MPTPRQLGTPNNFLTNVALSYAGSLPDPNIYIADQVFPVVGVDLPSGKYKTFPREVFFQDNVGPRPRGGYPRQVEYKMAEDGYTTTIRSLEATIKWDERPSYVGPPSGSPEAANVRLLQQQHLINRDRQWANTYFKTDVWGRDVTGIASGTPNATQTLQWDNDDSDPISFLMTESFGAAQKVGAAYAPRTLILGVNAYIRLANHPLLLSRLGVNNTRMLDRTGLATLLGVDKVLVAQATWNSGPEKETIAATTSAASWNWIVGANDALLVYTAPMPSTDAPSGGYTFAWRGLLGAQAFNPMAAVTQGTDARGKFDWYQLDVAYDYKVVAPELGVFFSG
ncbi:MAG TPA: hypothetical protein VNT52_18110, partial [Acidimicrobiales bacterium]|nr:hypothetical protein [Acidimicrobiales bacterium]